jgi:hypothetical protein
MSNIIRRPFVTAIDTAQRAAAQTAVQQAPQSWPCVVTAVSGSIVTVSFQVATPWTLQTMTMPLAECEYIRPPIQIGCKGFAVAASTTLGNMSGLGSSTMPDLSRAPNLSSLVFQPIANVAWTAPQDPNALELYGPTGVRIHTTDGTAFINVTETGIVLQFGENSLAITASGIQITAPGGIQFTGPISHGGSGGAPSTASFNATVTATGDVKSDGGAHSLSNHYHGNGNGGANTTPTID